MGIGGAVVYVGRANQKSSGEQEASHSNFGPGLQSLRRNYEEREYERQVLRVFSPADNGDGSSRNRSCARRSRQTQAR
jgi:hypothetical protein